MLYTLQVPACIGCMGDLKSGLVWLLLLCFKMQALTGLSVNPCVCVDVGYFLSSLKICLFKTSCLFCLQHRPCAVYLASAGLYRLHGGTKIRLGLVIVNFLSCMR